MNPTEFSRFKNRLMKNTRILKYSLFQSIIYPIAGLSQLFFIIIISSNLTLLNLKQALFILNLSIILIFLDFGLIYRSFRSASSNMDAEHANKQALVIHFQREAKKISIILFVTGFMVIAFLHSAIVGIYLIFTALITPGLISLHLLRGFGQDLRFLLTYNLSWPIALLILVILNLLEFGQQKYSYYIAFLPMVSSCITCTTAYFHVSKFYIKSNIKLEFENSKKLIPDFIIPTVLSISAGLALHTDKIFLMYSDDISHAEVYLFYGLLASSVLSMLTSIGSISWGDNLAKKVSSKVPHFLEFIFISFILSMFYFLGVFFLVWFNLTTIELNTSVLLFMSILIILNGMLVVAQARLTYSNRLVLRVIGNLIQVVVTLFLLQTLHLSQTLTGISLTVIVATLIHIFFLMTSIFALDHYSRK